LTAIGDVQVLVDESLTATASGACWIDVNSISRLLAADGKRSGLAALRQSAPPALRQQQVQRRRRRGEVETKGTRSP